VSYREARAEIGALVWRALRNPLLEELPIEGCTVSDWTNNRWCHKIEAHGGLHDWEEEDLSTMAEAIREEAKAQGIRADTRDWRDGEVRLINSQSFVGPEEMVCYLAEVERSAGVQGGIHYLPFTVTKATTETGTLSRAIHRAVEDFKRHRAAGTLLFAQDGEVLKVKMDEGPSEADEGAHE
jgi:hypothetical protein